MDAAWTKNRKQGFQPWPTNLVQRLHDFAQSGKVARLYARFYGRKDATLKAPDKLLLYVENLPAHALEKALYDAGIPKHTAKGKIDFHACRVAYINLVIGSGGVSVKEAQTLARHATPDLTMGLYAKAQEDRWHTSWNK